MTELLQYEFMRNALIAAVLASVACGIIGTYIVVKRIVFISGGIAHATFGGVGLAYFLGINPVIGIIPFSIISALAIGIVSKKSRLSEDSVIGIFWAMGMAMGVVFIGLTPGYAPDLFSYLFGNILTVPFSDIALIVILDIIIVAVVNLFYKEFLALCFDEEFAQICGVNVNGLYLILLALVAITIVVLIRIVGIMLVIALLTIPAAIAKQCTYSLNKMIFVSIFLSTLFTIGGLWCSYVFDLASGAVIILLSGCGFIGFSLYKWITRKKLLKSD